MARRTEDTANDSMDMLLDAMCNTFGAIIFIALLLSVLSHFTKPAGDAALDERAAQLDHMEQVAALQQEVDAMEVALGQRNLSVETQKVLEGLAGAATEERARQFALHENALVDQLDRLQNRRDAQRRTQQRQREDIRQLAHAIQMLRNEESDLTREDTGAKRSALGLPAESAPTQLDPLAHARLPMERTTTKNPFFIVVREERFYPLFWDAGQGGMKINNTAFTLTQDKAAGALFAAPRPGRGFPVGTTAEPSREAIQLRDTLRRLDQYADFSVYGDSYPAFIELRNFLGASAIDYNWEPIADDHVLILRSGIPSRTTQ